MDVLLVDRSEIRGFRSDPKVKSSDHRWKIFRSISIGVQKNRKSRRSCSPLVTTYLIRRPFRIGHEEVRAHDLLHGKKVGALHEPCSLEDLGPETSLLNEHVIEPTPIYTVFSPSQGPRALIIKGRLNF